jgi:hypothetical protein
VQRVLTFTVPVGIAAATAAFASYAIARIAPDAAGDRRAHAVATLVASMAGTTFDDAGRGLPRSGVKFRVFLMTT